MDANRPPTESRVDVRQEASLEAERCVLGSALDSLDGAQAVMRLVKAPDFQRPAHRQVFEAVCVVSAHGAIPDLMAVGAELLGRDQLKLVGGALALSDLRDHASALPNLPTWCARVRDAARRRRAISAAQRIAEDPESANGSLDELRAALEPEPDDSWASVMVPASQIDSVHVPALVSILGGGLLCRGDLAIFYGDAGTGKSWLTAMLVLAVARGEPWLGLPGPATPMRVGLLSFETHWERLAQRFRAIGGSSLPESLVLIAPPLIPPVINLLEPEVRAKVASICRTHQLDLLWLDPLSRLHQEDENDTQAGSRIMSAVHSLRAESGAAIGLDHHERKPATSTRDQSESDLAALRGSSRFQSDPTLLIRLKKHGELRKLVCAKANNGQPFDPIFVAPSKGDGPAVLVPDPQKTSENNRAMVLAAVAAATGHVTLQDVVSATHLADRTVRGHLGALEKSGEIVSEGSTRNRVFRIPANDVGSPSAGNETLWE